MILMLLLLTVTVFAGVETEPEHKTLTIDGLNYNSAEDGTFTFGTNLWHTRYFKSPVSIPFKEIWKAKLGNDVLGQPLITDKYVIATADDSIFVLDKKNGTELYQGKIQFDSTKNALYSSPFYLSNEDGWLAIDRLPRIYQGTRDGYMFCWRLLSNGHLEMDPKWVATSQAQAAADGTSAGNGGVNTYSNTEDARESGIVSSPVVTFDRNNQGQIIPYIVFGTYSKKVFVLDAKTGKAAIDKDYNRLDHGIQMNGVVSSSPITYRYAETNTFSEFAIGINKISEGYLYGGYVRDEIFDPNPYLNEAANNQTPVGESIKGLPNSIAVAEDKLTVQGELGSDDISYGIFIFADRLGYIYGYSQHEKQIVFKIRKYGDMGLTCYNTPTIVDNKYAIFSMTGKSGTDPSRLVCVSIPTALEIGRTKLNTGEIPYADDAIHWETAKKDSKGRSWIGATAMAIPALQGKAEDVIVISGSESTDASVPNLRAYYVRMKDSDNEVLPVENAFREQLKDGSWETKDGLFLPGGVAGEPAFMGVKPADVGKKETLMVVADGTGVLHAYSYDPQMNFSVDTLEAQPNELKPETAYVLRGTLGNETGVIQKDIPLDINFAQGKKPAGLPTHYRLFNSAELIQEGNVVEEEDDQKPKDLLIIGYDEVKKPSENPKDDPPSERDMVHDYYKQGYARLMIPEFSPHGLTVEFDMNSGDFPGNKLSYQLNLNMDPTLRTFEETTYLDNVKYLDITKDLPDLAVENLKVINVRPDTQVPVRFRIRNLSEIRTPRGTDVRVYVDGSLKQTIPVSDLGSANETAGGQQIDRRDFSITLGGFPAEGKHTIRIAVNENLKDYPEKKLENNTATKAFTISNSNPYCEGGHLTATGEYDVRFGGSATYGGVPVRPMMAWVPHEVSDGEGGTKTVHRWEQVGNVYRWTATLSSQVVFSATTLKSGHGTQCKVELKPGPGTNLKRQYFTFPTTFQAHGDNGTVQKFRRLSGDEGTKTYTYELVPPTVNNPLGEAKHFIPVSWKDGEYTLKICVNDVIVPGDKLTYEKDFPLTIKGHMYMDDVTN